MLAVRILVVSGECAFDLCRRDLPCLVRERQHLVSTEFDRARLVHADVSCFGRDDALIGAEQRVDDDGICLRAADEEEDFSVVRLAGSANLFAGGFGIGVKPVARRLLHVRLPKAAQNLGMCALHIVGGEGKFLLCTAHVGIISFMSDGFALLQVRDVWDEARH